MYRNRESSSCNLLLSLYPGSQLVDHIGLVGCPETIADINHAYPRSTGIEHGKKRREPAEAGAITYAGRHGDNRHIHQSADYGGEGAFHSGHGDNAVGLADQVGVRQEPVDPGYAYIVE